ncbi:hypothetical protein LINPERPRIM_LOCUS3402 [Linum perenne]
MFLNERLQPKSGKGKD